MATRCGRCGRTFESAPEPGYLDDEGDYHPGAAVSLNPSDEAPHHFVKPVLPGAPLPPRCGGSHETIYGANRRARAKELTT